MRTEIAIISALTLVLSMPLAFAQVSDDEVIDEFAGNPIEVEQDFVWLNSTHIQTIESEIYAPEIIDLGGLGVFENHTHIEKEDGQYLFVMHPAPYFEDYENHFVPYFVSEDDNILQVQFSGGKYVFDKNAGAVTIFDENGNIVINSDSYVVKSATVNSDVWTNLDVNNSPVITTFNDDGEKVIVTFTRSNSEGIFEIEYILKLTGVKTTAYFTNQSLENQKISFTQTLNLDNELILNDQTILLSDFVGQTFPRDVLVENQDLILAIKELKFNAGLGFEQLWEVTVHENGIVSLDYGNQDETAVISGQTVELDPTWSFQSSSADYKPKQYIFATFTAVPNASEIYYWSAGYQGTNGQGYAYGTSSPSSLQTRLGSSASNACYDTTQSGGGSSYGGWTYYWDDHFCSVGTSGGTTPINAPDVLQGIKNGSLMMGGCSPCNTNTSYGYHYASVEYGVANPPSAPQSLSIDTQDVANEITLNWSAPSSDGGASITNYKIYLDGTLIDTIGNVLTYDDTISGAEIGALLTYKVVAVNLAGDSPDSNNATVTSWDYPDQVTGLTGQSGINPTLNWSAPSSDGTITNYKIYRQGVLHDTIGNVLTYADSTNISSGSTYTYTVSAVSDVGEGAQSSSVNVVAGVPPDPPSLVLTHDSSNLNISVAITNGASMGTGTFTQWNIERSADGSTNWTSVGNPTTTPFTDTVPSTGDWYYRATTQSDHGTSAYSSIVNIAHVDPDLPSITASYYDPNSSDIQVVITDGASFGTGTFTSYSIERSADGSTGWTVVGTPTTSPFIDTTTPSVGDWYYRATTTTAHGTSSYSSNALASPVTPDVPTNLTSTISNPDPNPLTISLDWDSPINFGSGTLTGYEVYRDGSLITTTGTASQYDDTVTVQGTYVYTIKTVTTHAVSSLSGSTTISTPNQPSADSSVTLSIDNPNPNPLDITVSLVAPSSNGGSAVTGYNIFSSPDDITYTLVSSNVNTAQTITVANSGTWYFKSQAINNVGTAGVGSAISITTPTVPSSPQNANSVITDIDNAPYDVTVSWDLPTSTGGSALTGYNVYRQTGTGAFSLITTTTALGYVDTVPTALNQDYTFKIHAVNNVGESTGFTTTTITTGDVPDAPTLSFTTGTTALSWTVPNSDASITGYEIFRDGSSLTTVTTTTHSDFTPINFGQSYQYEVKAVSILGDSASSNSIVTTPETEITGMIVQGITGTGAVIDWNEPAYYQGQITSYNVYYSTPAQSANPTISAGTTTNTYSNFAPTLDYDTSYTFGVTINSPLGNSGFSNLVNATTNVDSSIVAYDPTTGGMEWFDIDSVSEQTVNVIEFQRETQNLNVNGTFTDVDTLQVGYPSWWDNMTCDIDYKFAQKTEQYVEGTDMTAVVNSADANQQVIGFEFHDIDNEVIEVECAPQVSQHDDEVSAKFIMTQQSTTGVPNIPLVTQIQAFQTGEYGTDGDFGALDIVGLFVILISMVGFNRLNPIVGVLLSASLVFGLSFFGIISLPTVLVGVVALVIFLAWGITRNR